jgi:hypothetical protein
MHSIIQKCIKNKIAANKIIQNLCNIFFNVQQLVIQLDVYLVLSLSLYHSSWTFQFINIFPFEVCAFVLKLQVALN